MKGALSALLPCVVWLALPLLVFAEDNLEELTHDDSNCASEESDVLVWEDLPNLSSEELLRRNINANSGYDFSSDGFSDKGAVLQWLVSVEMFVDEVDEDGSDTCVVGESTNDELYTASHDECLWTEYFGNGFVKLPCCLRSVEPSAAPVPEGFPSAAPAKDGSGDGSATEDFWPSSAPSAKLLPTAAPYDTIVPTTVDGAGDGSMTDASGPSSAPSAKLLPTAAPHATIVPTVIPTDDAGIGGSGGGDDDDGGDDEDDGDEDDRRKLGLYEDGCPARKEVDLSVQHNNGVCCSDCAPTALVAFLKTIVLSESDDYEYVRVLWSTRNAAALFVNGFKVDELQGCDSTEAGSEHTLTIELRSGYNAIVIKSRSVGASGVPTGIYMEFNPQDVEDYGLDIDLTAADLSSSCEFDDIPVWGDPDDLDEDEADELAVSTSSDYTYEGDDVGITENGNIIQWLVSDFFPYIAEVGDSGCGISPDPRDSKYTGEHQKCLWTEYFGNGYSELPCCADGSCPEFPASVDLAIQENGGVCCEGCAKGDRIGYAKTIVYSDAAATLDLYWVTDDASMLWVNGDLLITRESCQAPVSSSFWRTEVTLKAGYNYIVLKIRDNATGGDNFGLLLKIHPDDVAEYGLEVKLEAMDPTSEPSIFYGKEPSPLPTMDTPEPSSLPTMDSPEPSSLPTMKTPEPSSSPTGKPSATPTGEPTIEAIEVGDTVRAIISNLPEVVDSCAAVAVDGSLSKGEGLSFEWYLEQGDESVLEQLQQGSLFTLSSAILGEFVGQKLTVRLVVETHAGESDKTTASFSVSTGSVPLVTIDGGGFRTISLDRPSVLLSGQATIPGSCHEADEDDLDDESYDMTYDWALLRIITDYGAVVTDNAFLEKEGVVRSGATLEIPTELLSPGWVYDFVLKAVYERDEEEIFPDSAEGRASTRIAILRSDLKVRISGGTYQEVVADLESTLLCIASDPDFPLEPLRYEWTCASSALDNIVLVAEGKHLEVIPSSTSVGSSVACNCTAFAGENAAPLPPPRTASVELAVLPAVAVPPPHVTLLVRVNGESPEFLEGEAIANVEGYLAVLVLVEYEGELLESPGEVVTVQWEVKENGNAIDSITSDDFELVVEPDTLTRGSIYDFRVEVTPISADSASTTARLSVRVNEGPVSGVVTFAAAEGLLEDSGIPSIGPLTTEVRISLVDAEDPDGIEAFQFYILGCDPLAVVSSPTSAVTLSGIAAGSEFRLSPFTRTNSLTTFLPSALVVCPEHAADADDVDIDVLIIGVQVRDTLGATSIFTTGLPILRESAGAAPSPTPSPVVGGSTPPTSRIVDCQTDVVEPLRTLQDAERILTSTWMIAETTQNTPDGESAECKTELLRLVEEALSLNMEAPADLACQSLNAIVHSTEVADALPQLSRDLAFDLVLTVAQQAVDGLEADVGYDVFNLIECLLTAMEYWSGSQIGSETFFLDAFEFIHRKVSIELLKQMVPGQKALSVDTGGAAVIVEASSQKAGDADLLQLGVGNASVTLPANVSQLILLASQSCAGLVDEDYELDDFGFLGSVKQSNDGSRGRGFTLLLTICSGLTNFLDDPASAGIVLDLLLDAPDDVQLPGTVVLEPNASTDPEQLALLSERLSVECTTSSSPYNLDIPCPGGAITYECDGVSAGTVDVICPLVAFIANCERRDPGTGSWTSDACTFQGFVDNQISCQCEVGDASSTRRLERGRQLRRLQDSESDSLDFSSRFQRVGSEASFTFTEADNITADDAARASIVLIAVGSLVIWYFVALGVGHRMDKQERNKHKLSIAPESMKIREVMLRIPEELEQRHTRQRQMEILGVDAYDSLGRAEGKIGDTCSRVLLFVANCLFPQKAWKRRQQSLRRVVGPLSRDEIHPDLSEKSSLEPDPCKPKKGFFRMHTIGEGNETRDSQTNPLRERDSWGGYLSPNEETKAESRATTDIHHTSNPMRGNAEATVFAESYGALNQLHESSRRNLTDNNSSPRSSEGEGEPASSLPPSRVTRAVSVGGSSSSSGLLQPLCRMRSSSMYRVKSFSVGGAGLTGRAAPPKLVPAEPDAPGSGIVFADDSPGSYDEMERLDFIMAELEDEVHDMQKMRTNFRNALASEHEFFSILRYNATDRTIDDVYNEQATAVPYSQALSARRLDNSFSEPSPADSEDVVYFVSGSGIWAKAKAVWSNASRPQKITLLFLELLTIMAVDALFYTGSDDLIASTSFWSDIGAGRTSELGKQAASVMFFALLTACFALPPTALSLGIYSIKREMRAAETVARRILLHAEEDIIWHAQLATSNSASDYAIALLETLAILQLAQNQDYKNAVVPLQRHAAALEALRNKALTKEMTAAAEQAASGVNDVEAGSPNHMLELMSQAKWLKRRKAASQACDRVARQHEEDVRDGLYILMTPAERQRVDMDLSVKRVLEVIEALETAQASQENTGYSSPDKLEVQTFGPDIGQSLGVVIASKKRGKTSLANLFPQPSALYREWVVAFSSPSIYQLAQNYKCPITHVNAANRCSGCQGKNDSLIRLGRRRKKVALVSIYSIQAAWAAFCILYVVLFALTRSEVATAWFFSWIVATIFEVIYVSPILIFAVHALAPATVGLILERSLDKAKRIIAKGSAVATVAKRKAQAAWRAGH